MKKIIAVTLLAFSATSFAYSFNMSLNCNVAYGVGGSCQVFNQLPRPIQCYISARGQTRFGAWINLNGQGIIYPGHQAYVTVNANNPNIDPLLFVQANANCITL